MSNLYDISREIAASSVVYPGDASANVSPICEIGEAAPCHIMNLGLSTHYLTHVDVPAHFIKGGASLDDIALSRFTGPAVVVEAGGSVITAADVPVVPPDVNVLFKTRNSDQPTEAPFREDHVYLAEDAARALSDAGVNLVGIDYISIDRFGDENYPAHRLLLGAGILILEGLDLTGVNPGRYRLCAFPLRVASGDGSPVRAVLQEVR
jgi:arylformamidase